MSLRPTLERHLLDLWYGDPAGAHRRALAVLLSPLAGLTGAVARRRRARRKASGQRPPCPVVVVGNLVAGGAGKTPVSIAVARGLATRGRRVGLIASGYGSAIDTPRAVHAHSRSEEVGDEALLLARATGLPVAVGRQRGEALRLLLATHPDLDAVVSDDGLQHTGLPRTVELGLFDERGIGNGRLLPAGPLREPLAVCGELDALLLKGTTAPPCANPRCWRFDIEPVGWRPLGDPAVAPLPMNQLAARIGSEPVLALAGIARPERFFDMLAAAGIHGERLAPGDHAAIDPQRLAGTSARWILMTDKDAVKLPAAADARCWVLSIEARVAPGFFDWLLQALH